MQLHSDETECVFSFFVTVKAAILERKTTPQSATANHCVFDWPRMADSY